MEKLPLRDLRLIGVRLRLRGGGDLEDRLLDGGDLDRLIRVGDLRPKDRDLDLV